MEFILYTKNRCPLCNRLDDLIQPHLARIGLPVQKRDVLANEQWRESYGDRIPVLTCDGRVLLEGRPEAAEVVRVFAALSPSDV